MHTRYMLSGRTWYPTRQERMPMEVQVRSAQKATQRERERAQGTHNTV